MVINVCCFRANYTELIPVGYLEGRNEGGEANFDIRKQKFITFNQFITLDEKRF